MRAGLAELARLRDEPDLAEDLFAFLGLPLTATSAIVAARITQIGDANRRRRPDRERSLTDELLIHARELLVDGDPAVYRGWLTGEEPAPPVAEPVAPPVAEPVAPPVVDAPPPVVERPMPPVVAPVGPVTEEPVASSPPKISYARPPRAAPTPPVADPAPTGQPSTAPAADPIPTGPPSTPPVEAVAARRDPDGTLVVTWSWPVGVTEAFVSVGPASGPTEPGPGGRKVTNVKYEIDGGARLGDVPGGATLRVHTGARDGRGRLAWNAPDHARETIAP